MDVPAIGEAQGCFPLAPCGNSSVSGGANSPLREQTAPTVIDVREGPLPPDPILANRPGAEDLAGSGRVLDAMVKLGMELGSRHAGDKKRVADSSLHALGVELRRVALRKFEEGYLAGFRGAGFAGHDDGLGCLVVDKVAHVGGCKRSWSVAFEGEGEEDERSPKRKLMTVSCEGEEKVTVSGREGVPEGKEAAPVADEPEETAELEGMAEPDGTDGLWGNGGSQETGELEGASQTGEAQNAGEFKATDEPEPIGEPQHIGGLEGVDKLVEMGGPQETDQLTTGDEPDQMGEPGKREELEKTEEPDNTDKPDQTDGPQNTGQPGLIDGPPGTGEPEEAGEAGKADKLDQTDEPQNTDELRETDGSGQTNEPEPEKIDKLEKVKETERTYTVHGTEEPEPAECAGPAEPVGQVGPVGRIFVLNPPTTKSIIRRSNRLISVPSRVPIATPRPPNPKPKLKPRLVPAPPRPGVLPFHEMTDKEIADATNKHTNQNRLYACDFNRQVVRKNTPRPPSPNPKIQTLRASQARAKRMLIEAEKGIALGPGDDESYNPDPSSKVQWSHPLESEAVRRSPSRARELPAASILARKVPPAQLPLNIQGNYMVSSPEAVATAVGERAQVTISKIVYKGEKG